MLARSAEDADAFVRLYDLVAAPVFGLVLRVLRDRAQAEEVTQEVVTDVWRLAGTYDPARGSPRSWIFMIAHRKAVSRVRASEASRRRDVVYAARNTAPQYDLTVDAAHASIESQRVRAAWSRLRPLQRQAVGLAYFDGLTYRAVAVALDVPHATIKTRIRDGLANLRTQLAEDV